MKVITVRKAQAPIEGYPLEVVAIEDTTGKVVSQPNLVRDRVMGLVFGNGMIMGLLMNDKVGDVAANVVFQDE